MNDFQIPIILLSAVLLTGCALQPLAAPDAPAQPALLAEIPLAPVESPLVDVRHDAEHGLLFVGDAADRLHVLDAATYSLTGSRAGRGCFICSGLAVYRSEDAGLQWSLVFTGTGSYHSLPLATYLPGGAAQPSIRIGSDLRSVEYTADGGATWQTGALALEETDWLTEVVFSPLFASDRTAYLRGQTKLWRSTDGGATWQRLHDPRFEDRDYERYLSVLATSPIFADGTYLLFVGTLAGEFWSIDPRGAAIEGSQPNEQ